MHVLSTFIPISSNQHNDIAQVFPIAVIILVTVLSLIVEINQQSSGRAMLSNYS